MRSSVRYMASKVGAVVALGAIGLSGCAAVHGSSSARAEDAGASSPVAAEMIHSLFPATGAQYAAGSLFDETVKELESTATARCMSGHGFSQQVPPVSAASIAQTAEQHQDNSQFPNLAWMAKNGLFVPATQLRNGGPPPPSSPAQRALLADERKCGLAAARPVGQVTGALSGLQQQWLNVINQVEASGPVQAAARGFAMCAERHGVPTADAGSLNAFLAWTTGVFSQTISRSAMVVTEHHWVGVFVPCARKLVAVQERLQLKQQSSFLQDHYQQILAAEDRVPAAMTALERLAAAPPGVVSN